MTGESVSATPGQLTPRQYALVTAQVFHFHYHIYETFVILRQLFQERYRRLHCTNLKVKVPLELGIQDATTAFLSLLLVCVMAWYCRGDTWWLAYMLSLSISTLTAGNTNINSDRSSHSLMPSTPMDDLAQGNKL